MHEIRDKSGAVAARSRNLRGIRAHASKRPVKAVYVRRCDDGTAELTLLWHNGDLATVPFASFRVLLKTLSNWRSIQGARLSIDGFYYGALERKNPLWTSFLLNPNQ